MAWRFQKRIKIAPGVRINLSKSGISATGGMPGANLTVGKDGQQLNLGAPGTGLSTQTKLGGKRKQAAKAKADDPPGLIGIIAAVAIIALALWGIFSLFG